MYVAYVNPPGNVPGEEPRTFDNVLEAWYALISQCIAEGTDEHDPCVERMEYIQAPGAVYADESRQLAYVVEAVS